MHFHLPKPLHGGREFVGEVGIIVVGVLIALSAEQFAEFFHNRSQVRHGEEALTENFRRFVTYTAELDAYAPCVAARSAELRQLIDRSAVDIYDDAKVEWSDWGILASLSGPSRAYDGAEEAQDRLVLARAVHQDALMRLTAKNTLDRIKRTGLLNDAAFDSAMLEGRRMAAKMAMCRSIQVGTPSAFSLMSSSHLSGR